MDKENALVVFEGSKIRRIWHNNEWWFVVEDIVAVLVDSADIKQYIQKMKQRDEELAKGWVQFVHTLSIHTSGGLQSMNCSNTQGIFRIIQSIPSQKAEPFKQWLAQVGYKRVKEIENPSFSFPHSQYPHSSLALGISELKTLTASLNILSAFLTSTFILTKSVWKQISPLGVTCLGW